MVGRAFRRRHTSSTAPAQPSQTCSPSEICCPTPLMCRLVRGYILGPALPNICYWGGAGREGEGEGEGEGERVHTARAEVGDLYNDTSNIYSSIRCRVFRTKGVPSWTSATPNSPTSPSMLPSAARAIPCATKTTATLRFNPASMQLVSRDRLMLRMARGMLMREG